MFDKNSEIDEEMILIESLIINQLFLLSHIEKAQQCLAVRHEMVDDINAALNKAKEIISEKKAFDSLESQILSRIERCDQEVIALLIYYPNMEYIMNAITSCRDFTSFLINVTVSQKKGEEIFLMSMDHAE